ncbi:DUF1097 domain-containing protein [uncultured Nocardioides sp.]|uniref:DUF1097 domain-containing protein n=1 Tax=uncultured Nocardioides sp. TaxID=198441 RepID=UPI00260A5DFF|nr:DUF1097 domain-containing protein [uncultured Nocardioides sp.]
MLARLKSSVPLALVIGVLAFLWCEFALNFTFHWVTNGDLGNGLDLPSNFHLVVPAAFISWGFIFAAGADTAAFVKVTVASVVGGVAGLAAMLFSSAIAPLPDFWGIALAVAVFAIILVLMSALGDWHYVPATFGAFASVFFWWTATGLDTWAPDGGGVGNSVQALADPLTAGAGAFGGVISTPLEMVFVNVTVSLLCGCLLGLASLKLTGLISPAAPAEEPQRQETTSA